MARTTDSPLPHSLEAERAVLGAAVLNPEALNAVIPVLRAEDFFAPTNARIYRQLQTMAAGGTPIDLVTLTASFDGQLEQAGGAAYLASLIDQTIPRPENAIEYAGIIREKSERRRLAHLCESIQQKALGGIVPVEDLANDAQVELAELAASSSLDERGGWRETFSERIRNAQITFLVEGIFPEGNNFFGGLAEGGKTWLALALSKSLVTGKPFVGFRVPKPVPVIYLTPEVGNVSLSMRLEKIGMPQTPLFLFRTQDARDCFRLDDRGLFAAVRELKPVVVLDTLIRFSNADDENSSAQNQALALAVFRLRREGARAVLANHHQPKAAADEAPTLENTLRGTGDFGAVADAVYHVRKVNEERLTLRVTPVKARDFVKPKRFEVQGVWPAAGGIEFLPLVEESDEERVRSAIEENPSASYREVARRTGVTLSRVSGIAERLGWERQGDLWLRKSQ